MVDQVAKITSKGQVTIPKEVRQALGVEVNDHLLFVIEGNQATIIPLKRRTLSEFRGALPATRPYEGIDATRQVYRGELAKRFVRDEE